MQTKRHDWFSFAIEKMTIPMDESDRMSNDKFDFDVSVEHAGGGGSGLGRDEINEQSRMLLREEFQLHDTTISKK